VSTSSRPSFESWSHHEGIGLSRWHLSSAVGQSPRISSISYVPLRSPGRSHQSVSWWARCTRGFGTTLTARASARPFPGSTGGSHCGNTRWSTAYGQSGPPMAPMNVLVVHSKLDNRPCKWSGNRNGRRHHLVELPQPTTLLVVPDRSGWRCCLGVGEAPRRGPSTSGSYRLNPRPSAYRGRSRLGHQLGVRSSCRSSAASSATRVNASSTDTSAWCQTPVCSAAYRLAGARCSVHT
jgi:hypothetical protein